MSLLEKIVAALKSQRGPDGRPASWWRWAVVAVLLLVGLAVAAWVVRRNSQELARLRHEEFERKLDARRAQTKAVVNRNAEKVAGLAIEIAAAAARHDEAAQAVVKVEEEHAETLARIEHLRWSDLPRADRHR